MKCSIIIPVFNAQKTIEKTLKSLKNQTEKEFEIIIVDDGSTDKTEQIIKEFTKKEKLKLKYFKQQNKGPSSARNLGAKKANSKIIIFTDSDCELEKNMIKEILKSFRDKTVLGVQGTYKTKQKSLIAQFVQTEIENRYSLMEKAMKQKGQIDFIGSYCAAYRKKTFFEFGGFDESYLKASGEDTDLSYKISSSKKGKLILNRKANVFHMHPESLQDYLIKKFTHAKWRTKLYSQHKNKIIKDSYTPQILKLQIGLTYLLGVLFLGNVFFQQLINYAIITIGILILSFLPFSLHALKKNLILGILSPIILFLRTIAFSSGLLIGIIFGVKK